jgi:hypothetical protein
VGWVLTPAEERLQVSLGLADDWPARVPREFAPTGGLLTPEAVARFAVAFVEDGTVAVSGAVVELEQYPIIGRNPAKTVDRMATM